MTVITEPDLDAAIEFLKTFYAGSEWPLSAALPVARGRGIESAEMFSAETEDECRGWIRHHNVDEALEIYFQLNVLKVALSTKRKKKASENDVRASRYLYVDIDPEKKTEDLAANQAEMDRLIEGLDPKPTWIIDSGRGRWCLWRLEPMVHLDGKDEKGKEGPILADVKARARTLELQIGKKYADNCRNVDRIARLPGTINHKTGEVARVREHNPTRVYKIADFVPHPSAETGSTTYDKADPTVGTELSTDIHFDQEIHFDYEQLPVDDEVKRTIATGGEIPKRFKSRSEAVWFVLRALVRIATPDLLIEHIFLDPDNGISESILERKDNRLLYIRRQIERARTSFLKFVEDDKGRPLKDHQQNIHVAVAKLGVDVRYNEFSDRTMIAGLAGFGPVLDDKALSRLWLEIDRHFRFRPVRQFFDTVILDLAMYHSYHPVRDYLSGLGWDGTERIDTWLIDYAGAEDTNFVRAVGAIVLVAACRRVRQPGCKFDEMLVLESPRQGTEKSTGLNTLAVHDDWFTDHLPLGHTDPKVFIECTQGRWIIEAADLSGMNKSEVNQLKSVLSRRIDKARMAYGRLSLEWSRQCVVVGTTNSEEYLKDQTGNRRFWPVRVKRLDIEKLKADRDQLWAEAAAREAKGSSIRLAEDLWPEAGNEQASRTIADPYREELEFRLGQFNDVKIAAADVWTILGIQAGHRDSTKNERLGAAMRDLGWRRANTASTIDIDGRKVSGYVKGEKPWKRIIVYYDRDDRSVIVHTESESPPPRRDYKDDM